MKIMNIEAQDIKACCVVQYKGYEISMSTILSFGSIEVNDIGSTEYIKISTFEKAIEYIESKQPLQPTGSVELVIYKDWVDSSQIGGYYFMLNNKHHVSCEWLVKNEYSLTMGNYFKLCEQAEREMDSDHDYLKVCLTDLHTLMTNKYKEKV